MPADFSEYVNLAIFDKEPGDIYRDSIELARLTMPEFNLRPGTPEDAIFQAMAYVTALNIVAINRLPDRLMSGLVSMLGFQRQESISAEVDVVITLSSYEGGTIPAGTVFSFETLFEDEVQDFSFETTEAIEVQPTDLEVSSDYPSAVTTVVCLQPGVIAPIGNNVELSVLSSGTDIFSVFTATPSNFANGINDDTSEEYLSKATTYLRSLTSAITTANQMDAYLISAYPSLISRAKTYDLTNGDPVSGDITVSRSSGIVNTYLEDDIATIQTEAPHLFVSGDVVRIDTMSSSASAIFNGEYEISSTTESTISFLNFKPNSASIPITGSAYAGQEESGFVSVFVYGLNDFVSITEKAELLNEIQDRSVAGLTFNILDPDLLTLEITGTVTISNQYEQLAVQESIENILIDYLSPVTFPYTESRIRTGQIIALISSIPGVVYVQSLSFSPTGDGWLPQESISGSFGADLLFRNKGALPILGLDDINITYTVSDVS
jgi:hypothetical protein